ncbi:MAG: hypothetical protein WAT84_03955 [Candidatus Moraniibacteriota bacterium]
MEPMNAGTPLLSWRAPEHIHVRPNPRGLMVSTVLLALIIAYAIFTNSPIMAITFFLIGIVGYLFLTRDPREFEFAVTSKGILGGKTLYAFEDIHSFWIYDEPPLEGVLSLHSNGIISPYIHIPIGDVPPEELRDLLLDYVLEEKHIPTVIDTLEKMLHI